MVGDPPGRPIVHVAVIAVATGAIWVGSGWLEEAAETLSAYYGLPAVVQGRRRRRRVELPGVRERRRHRGHRRLRHGRGRARRSAIFNVLVIPGLSGFGAEGDLESSRAIVYKEAQFYMIAVSALIVTFSLTVIYYPVSSDPIVGELTRPVAAIPRAVRALPVHPVPRRRRRGDRSNPGGGRGSTRVGKLAAGLLVIGVAVERLVGSVESLGATFGVPEFAGITIVAAATRVSRTRS